MGQKIKSKMKIKLIDVGAFLYNLLTVKESVFKSCMRTRPSVFYKKIAILCQIKALATFLYIFQFINCQVNLAKKKFWKNIFGYLGTDTIRHFRMP